MYAEKGEGGLAVLAVFTVNSMKKTAVYWG
jgi:hypothetical protein